MRRFSVLLWAGLVSACAASSVVGCGDDDTAGGGGDEPEPQEAGVDASRRLEVKDAAGRDSQATTDTGARDSQTIERDASGDEDAALEAGTDAGTPDADAATTPDADASTAPDADASPPPVDASPDADASPPPVDAGNPAICHQGTPSTVTTLFPAGGSTAGGKVAFSDCSPSVTIGADGSYAGNVKTLIGDVRYTVTGIANHRRTVAAELRGSSFGGPPTNGALPIAVAGPNITPYSALRAHILVRITDATGACQKSGNTVSVNGHPEAVVKYVNPAGDSVGAQTSADGLVWISDITAGGANATLTFTSGVAGCTADTGVFTGGLPLGLDSVTMINVTMSP